MPSTFARPHSKHAQHPVAGSNPSRQPRHYIHASTTATYRARIDYLAVERVVNGEHPLPELTLAEQQFAARLMSDEGCGTRAIAERVGVQERTVTRWRAQWKEEEEGGRT